jgi:hypothetical protein
MKLPCEFFFSKHQAGEVQSIFKCHPDLGKFQSIFLRFHNNLPSNYTEESQNINFSFCEELSCISRRIAEWRPRGNSREAAQHF